MPKTVAVLNGQQFNFDSIDAIINVRLKINLKGIRRLFIAVFLVMLDSVVHTGMNHITLDYLHYIALSHQMQGDTRVHEKIVGLKHGQKLGHGEGNHRKLLSPDAIARNAGTLGSHAWNPQSEEHCVRFDGRSLRQRV